MSVAVLEVFINDNVNFDGSSAVNIGGEGVVEVDHSNLCMLCDCFQLMIFMSSLKQLLKINDMIFQGPYLNLKTMITKK